MTALGALTSCTVEPALAIRFWATRTGGASTRPAGPSRARIPARAAAVPGSSAAARSIAARLSDLPHQRPGAHRRIIHELPQAGIGDDEVGIHDQGPPSEALGEGRDLAGAVPVGQHDDIGDPQPGEPLRHHRHGIGIRRPRADERPHASSSRSPGGEVRKPVPHAPCMVA